jgi:hypothetical protein
MGLTYYIYSEAGIHKSVNRNILVSRIHSSKLPTPPMEIIKLQKIPVI